MNVLVTTCAAPRHRLFLAKAKEALGPHWRHTLIQGTRDSFSDAPCPSASRPFLDHPAAKAVRQAAAPAVHRVQRALRKQAPRLVADADLQALWPEVVPEELDALPGVAFCQSPNDPAVLQWLQDAAPDLILIFGGRILQGPWVTIAPLGAINMHYGILPHYRSSHSTQFALIHERLDRIGATIHYIDAGVDTGPTISLHPVTPTPGQSLENLVAQVYAAGIDGLLKVAKDTIASGEKPSSMEHERQAHSFFPSRLGSTTMDRLARWRLQGMQSPWPPAQSAVESLLLRRARSPLRGVPAMAPLRRMPHGVYVFLYHSVVDTAAAAPWETAYTKAMTRREDFRDHLRWLLAQGMRPLRLSDAPTVLRTGQADAPYFVITFDDAFVNIAPAIREDLLPAGVFPTIFAGGSFCEGAVYYRVLLALLQQAGKRDLVRQRMRQEVPRIPWSDDAAVFDGQLKTHYTFAVTERVATSVYLEAMGGQLPENVHLTVAQLRELQSLGVEIGNHTWSHPTLAALDNEQIHHEINSNSAYFDAAGVPCIPWLSYPNGRPLHVNDHVHAWMRAHPEYHGIFAAGGINMIPSRTEWFRISIGNFRLPQFKTLVKQHLQATRAIVPFTPSA